MMPSREQVTTTNYVVLLTVNIKLEPVGQRPTRKEVQVDVYMHTAIAVAVIITAFLIGYYVSMAQHIEKGVTFTLDKLEKENLIRVNDTTEGKKILSISEVHGELMNENTILKDNVYQLEKQLNTSRKKLVDKLV